MRSRRFAALVGCAVAASASASGAVVAGRPADAGSAHVVTGAHRIIEWRAPRPESSRAALASPRFANSVRTFTKRVKDGTSTFSVTMIGASPFTAQATPSTTIKTKLIPVKIAFPNGNTWDPTVKDGCDSGANALTRTKHSPVFQNQPWTFGNRSEGTTQYVDAFRRAEFDTFTGPTGGNRGYHVLLSVATLPKITVNVPGADAYYYVNTPCGNHELADVNINWLDGYLRGTVIPSLTASGVTAKTLPIFLLHNAVEFVNDNPSSCCVVGYHGAFTDASGNVQTYAVADYDNSGFFTDGGVSDVSALSHEVGEWMDDPNVVNPTKPWGNVGQVQGHCQNNYEVGDPLSGTLITDSFNEFTYHPQELAFFSWFYHQAPSYGVPDPDGSPNGWYSDEGTFTSSAAPCP